MEKKTDINHTFKYINNPQETKAVGPVGQLWGQQRPEGGRGGGNKMC